MLVASLALRDVLTSLQFFSLRVREPILAIGDVWVAAGKPWELNTEELPGVATLLRQMSLVALLRKSPVVINPSVIPRRWEVVVKPRSDRRYGYICAIIDGVS